MNNNQELKKNKTWIHIYEKFKAEVEDLNELYNHPGEKGDANELVLINFLKSFLPGKYEISKNKFLLDREGNESTEQDIVIWDSMNYPRIFTGTKYFMLESVLACIEVKTTLDSEKLKDSILKIKALRNMKYFKRVEDDLRWQIHPPLCFIFAYNTSWKKYGTLIDNIERVIRENEIKPSERFDYLYIMRKGITVEWDIPHEFLLGGSGDNNYRKVIKYFEPTNKRWPQFFPSKLKKEFSLELHENQVSQPSQERDKGYYSDLIIENQILGMLDFLTMLCQAVEDQKIFHPHGLVSLSYSKAHRGKGGRSSREPF